jgi:hypothetical protein
VWRHVGASIPVSCAWFFSYLNHGFVSSFSKQKESVIKLSTSLGKWTVHQEAERKALLDSDANVERIAS